MMPLPVWLTGLMFLPGGGVSVSGPMFLPGGIWGGVSIHGSLCLRGSLPGRPPDRDPQYGDEWVLRILLERILVIHIDSNGMRSPFKINLKNVWKFADMLGKILETCQVRKLGALK